MKVYPTEDSYFFGVELGDSPELGDYLRNDFQKDVFDAEVADARLEAKGVMR